MVFVTARRMLVTGAGGMVGSYVAGVFQDYELTLADLAGDLPRLDVRDAAAVKQAVRDVKPDIVLHLAAATDVDHCEKDPDGSYHHNAIGTQNVALACQAAGAVMVYISTAGVFSGEKHDPYIEFDPPAPANVYGHSKLAG